VLHTILRGAHIHNLVDFCERVCCVCLHLLKCFTVPVVVQPYPQLNPSKHHTNHQWQVHLIHEQYLKGSQILGWYLWKIDCLTYIAFTSVQNQISSLIDEWNLQ